MLFYLIVFDITDNFSHLYVDLLLTCMNLMFVCRFIYFITVFVGFCLRACFTAWCHLWRVFQRIYSSDILPDLLIGMIIYKVTISNRCIINYPYITARKHILNEIVPGEPIVDIWTSCSKTNLDIGNTKKLWICLEMLYLKLWISFRWNFLGRPWDLNSKKCQNFKYDFFLVLIICKQLFIFNHKFITDIFCY